MGFPKGWQGCSKGFPKSEARWKSRGAENSVHSNCFTWIYILFKIGHFSDVSEWFKY